MNLTKKEKKQRRNNYSDIYKYLTEKVLNLYHKNIEEIERMDISTKILSDITVYMKYARYIPEKKRRETWKELVERNKKMHIKKYPELKSQIDKAYKMVLIKKYYHQ